MSNIKRLSDVLKDACSKAQIKYEGCAEVGPDILVWVDGQDCSDKIVGIIENLGYEHTPTYVSPNGIGIYILNFN